MILDTVPERTIRIQDRRNWLKEQKIERETQRLRARKRKDLRSLLRGKNREETTS
jgi:hypothetical protein